MIRLIVVILLAAGAFWCYNNVDFSNIVDNMGASFKKEKTIKAVTEKRQADFDNEQSVIENN